MIPGLRICGVEIKSGGMEDLISEITKRFLDSRERRENPNKGDSQAQIE